MTDRSGWRRLMRRAALVLAFVAGAAAAPAAAPVNPAWTADPDEQFLLDVQIRQKVFGEGVRAYRTPEGTCVVLGDFLTALDVPMRIDLAANKASGWAFHEANRISIDRAASSVQFDGKRESFAATTIREVPEGWCIDSQALGRWFGLGVKASTNGSVLLVTSEAKLPVELAKERHDRAARLHKASFDLKSLPQVPLPYRMWRTPALDFVVDAGVTYNAHSGVQVDRRASLVAAGEILGMSFDTRLTTNNAGIPEALRFKAFRADPDGQLLGPLKATNFAIGDVEALADPFVTSGYTSGRGALVTNRPVAQPTAFDRTSLTGDLPSGWEAELYRNGELIAFSPTSGDNRYHFDDIQLLYGDNRLEVVSYGPQGQVRSRIENFNVAAESVPTGKTWYWAGVNQPGHDLLDFRTRGTTTDPPPLGATPGLLGGPTITASTPIPAFKDQGVRAAAMVEHGLGKRTSVAALVQTLVVDDQRVSFVEGSVRQSIGPALVQAAIALDDHGGLALRAEALARIGAVNLAAQSIVTRDFAARGNGEPVQEHRLTIDTPVKLGRTTIPLYGDLRFAELAGGDRQLSASLRSSIQLRRFNLSTVVKYQKNYSSLGATPDQFDVALIGSGRIGPVRLRGGTDFDLSHGARFRQAELNGYWSLSDNSDLETGVAYEGDARRARARVGYIHRFSGMAVAVTGEAASDGSIAAGLNLAFSLSGGDRMRLSRQPLATAGSVTALVFRDLNNNGVRDEGEPVEKGALITAGLRTADRPTDDRGLAGIAGLQLYQPVAIGIDTTSLSDPMLVPAKAAQVVTPRPGVAAAVEIALVGGGDVEGILLKDGGGGFEGLDVEIVDSAGKVVATTRSDYDGYFLFERVGYGHYSVRLTADSARAARSTSELGQAFIVAPDRSSVRLGTIRVGVIAAKIASAH